ncbi:MAG: hypothetical protein HRT53_01870 [Colwellia sp.]|nr:hypothetical protein [Colwellia sp.]
MKTTKGKIMAYTKIKNINAGEIQVTFEWSDEASDIKLDKFIGSQSEIDWVSHWTEMKYNNITTLRSAGSGTLEL